MWVNGWVKWVYIEVAGVSICWQLIVMRRHCHDERMLTKTGVQAKSNMGKEETKMHILYKQLHAEFFAIALLSTYS